MGRGWRANLVAACAVVAVVALAAGAEGAAAASHRFQTGFFDDVTFTGPFAGTGFTRAAEAGGTIVRLGVNWNSVAPTRPADPKNPADPAYRWAGLDAEVAAAIAAGQAPIADIHAAPVWALSTAGAYPAAYPDPAQFAAFAHAAAQHYDGVHGPRVAIWEIFNEPNLGLWLEPQFVNGQSESAIWYRDVVNRSALLIKSVHADNLIVAGNTAPYFDRTPSTQAVNPTWGPLGFLRAFLCLTPELTVDAGQPGCPGTVAFDAWSHHPYTEGGPMREATLPDDVELGRSAEAEPRAQSGVGHGADRRPRRAGAVGDRVQLEHEPARSERRAG